MIVDSIEEQDSRVEQIRDMFPDVSIDNRRLTPSHGYRAVHAIVMTQRRLVEIQIRTREQHLWAELSEKLSDVVDPALKYGGGPTATRETLLEYSRLIAQIEALEVTDIHSANILRNKEAHFERMPAGDPDRETTTEILARARATQNESEEGTRHVKKLLADLLTGYYNDLSDNPWSS